MRHVVFMLFATLLASQAVAQEIVPLEKKARANDDGMFLAAGATSTATDDLLRSIKAQGGGAMSSGWGTLYLIGTTTGLRPMNVADFQWQGTVFPGADFSTGTFGFDVGTPWHRAGIRLIGEGDWTSARMRRNADEDPRDVKFANGMGGARVYLRGRSREGSLREAMTFTVTGRVIGAVNEPSRQSLRALFANPYLTTDYVSAGFEIAYQGQRMTVQFGCQNLVARDHLFESMARAARFGSPRGDFSNAPDPGVQCFFGPKLSADYR
jgi:hypothetical protein